MSITVTDEAGNSTTCDVTLTLVDDENPSITDCADDQDVLSSANGTGDCTNFIIPDLTDEVTADDNCTAAGNLTITQSPAAGTYFQPAGCVSHHGNGRSGQQHDVRRDADPGGR